MSLVHTESFVALPKYSGTDSYSSSTANEARAAHIKNLARAGYSTYVPANTSADTSGGFLVRDDPIYPGRTVLTQSSDAGSGVNLGVSAAFKKNLPTITSSLLIGFSIFVPAEYVPNSANSTVPVFRMNATTAGDTGWTDNSATKEVFRITNDLSVRWSTDAVQGAKKLRPGYINYIEVRIDAGFSNVWIDDSYVMQKPIVLNRQAIAFIFENNANPTGTNLSGNPGRWALGNLYILAADSLAPNVRLGATTRVIGQRPDADVDVDFIRPVDSPTNASVVGQDLVDAPPKSLQASTIGDSDTYASSASISDISAMPLIHAVSCKVLVSNLEPTPHKVRPYIKYQDSGEGADLGYRTPKLELLTSPSTKDIRAMGVRKTDKSVWMVGNAETIYKSGPNYDISTWTQIRSVPGSTTDFTALYMRDDGGILIGSIGANTVQFIAPGTDVFSAGSSAVAGGVVDFYPSPDGTTNLMAATAFYGGNNLSYISMASANGGSPQHVGWANLGPQLAPDTVGGMVRGRSNSTHAIIIQNAAATIVGASANMAGTSYFTRSHGDTARLYAAATWDGSAWLIGATSNDAALNGNPRIRRSTDTVTWTQVNTTGSMIGSPQQLRFGESNTTSGASIFGGDGGALLMSDDGLNWREFSRITTKNLLAAVLLNTGDFLVGGQDGTLLRTVSLGNDTLLPSFSNYTMAFGSAVKNPKTDAAWTSVEAAGATFGVKLVE